MIEISLTIPEVCFSIIGVYVVCIADGRLRKASLCHTEHAPETTPEYITAAFGKAVRQLVDMGAIGSTGPIKSISFDDGQVRRKGYICQVPAIGKSPIHDGSDGIRHRNAGQSGAVPESVGIDGGHTCRNGHAGHGLTEQLIVQSISELEKPALIFKGRQDGSILVITSVEDQKDRNIVIAIEFDRQEGFTQVNSIRSVYGRDNLDYFIGENIENRNLLAANKEKADELLRSIGKSYPKENTFISFN